MMGLHSCRAGGAPSHPRMSHAHAAFVLAALTLLQRGAETIPIRPSSLKFRLVILIGPSLAFAEMQNCNQHQPSITCCVNRCTAQTQASCIHACLEHFEVLKPSAATCLLKAANPIKKLQSNDLKLSYMLSHSSQRQQTSHIDCSPDIQKWCRRGAFSTPQR